MQSPRRVSLALLVMLLLTGGYAAFGFYQVEPDEQAVVLRLGRYHRTTDPGVHWHAAGIERIEIRRVTTLVEEEFGFRTVGTGAAREFAEHPQEKRMLTSDTNLVDAEFVVQFRIRDLRAYLFNVKDVSEVIRDAAQAAMREVVARNQIDNILTAEKAIIASQGKERIQAILDLYGVGVEILGVQLQDVEPPAEVKAAFAEVTTADQDAARMVVEARGYADQVLPRAQAEATELINEAEAYKFSRVREAEGEAARFSTLLAEYRRSPRVTRERMYLETLEAILPKMDKVIIQEGLSERVLPYLPIGKRKELR